MSGWLPYPELYLKEGFKLKSSFDILEGCLGKSHKLVSADPRGERFVCSLKLDSLSFLSSSALPSTSRIMHSYLLAYSNPISEHNGPGNSFPIWVSPVFKTFVRNIVKPFHHSLHTKLRWLSARVWRPIAFLLFSLLFFSLQLFICYLNQNTVNSCVCVLCLSIYGTLFLWRIVWVILSGISMFCNVNFLVFFFNYFLLYSTF